MKDYYFIGGAPLTGKSSILKRLTEYVPVSTDDIRSFLHNTLSPNTHPDLFYGYGLDTIEFYKEQCAKYGLNIYSIDDVDDIELFPHEENFA